MMVSELPRGAATTTARRSKWFFWSSTVSTLVMLTLLLGQSGGRLWVQVLLISTFSVQAVIFFRSWRVLKRYEAQAAGQPLR